MTYDPFDVWFFVMLVSSCGLAGTFGWIGHIVYVHWAIAHEDAKRIRRMDRENAERRTREIAAMTASKPFGFCLGNRCECGGDETGAARPTSVGVIKNPEAH